MKQLFICKEHHKVLLPWAQVRRTNKELNLLTFDHHTDTHGAFCHHLYYNKDENLNALISKMDFRDDNTIISAIKKLKNDEHIDTAIKCGIFNRAFSVSHNGTFDKPCSNEFDSIHQSVETKIQFLMGQISLPKIQTYPDARLYIVGTDQRLNHENGISDKFLDFVLFKIRQMSNIQITETEFILDIDLDYFHSYEALDRIDIKLFQHLLSCATAITIATEPDYAYEGIDQDEVLKRMLSHVKKVCANELEIIDLRE